MRWRDTPEWECRHVIRFALLPMKIGLSIRWLEWVKIKQRMEYGRWRNIEFID